MTYPPAKVVCIACCGRGVVPHERRSINGEPDPWDHQTEETCTKCGGCGKIVAPPPPDDAMPQIPMSA